MSPRAANVSVALVALIQAMIAIVEMFFWNKPRVHARLEFTDTEAKKVAPIVANAGLYNSFLAAGLIWGLAMDGTSIKLFFLVCIIVAGIFGAITLKWTTLLLQTTPGTIALLMVYMSKTGS